MDYLLMNKDSIVSTFVKDSVYGEPHYKETHRYGLAPYGFTSIHTWLNSRQAAVHRKHIERLMRECGCYDTEGYIRLLHCVSINDTYWAKREDEEVTWKDVSLFYNDFDETITRIAFEGEGLYGEEFSSTSPEFSLDGSYEKCCIHENGNLYIIKRGTTGYANAGLEPYCEVFSSPIYKAIVGDSVDYELVHYHSTVASKCKVFTNNEIGFASFGKISKDMDPYTMRKFYESIGSADKFDAMLVADAVCFNSDRHLGNHGIVYYNDTQEVISKAPTFDHNLALIPYAMKSDFDSDIDSYISESGPKIGKDWITVAKGALSSDIRSKLINLKGYTIPFEGDEKFPRWRVERMNDLINRQIDLILR